MEKNSIPSLNKWLLGGLIGFGMASLLCGVVHAQQSLIWPTPEAPGVVRDLTHLPAVPFYQTDPTNLNDLLWSQPGSAMNPTYSGPVWGPDNAQPSWKNPPMGGSGYGYLSPSAQAKVKQIMQGIIEDFERATR